MKKKYKIQWHNHCLDLGAKTCVMGILNITPDSFSDGGYFFNTDLAVEQGMEMAAAGADIIDIGGESTRPFSDFVSAKEENDRVVPVIEKLAKRISIPISIDTNKANVAKKALKAGASIINDISALGMDPEMAALAAEFDVPVILMHMKGRPKTMQVSPEYDDLIGDIKSFFKDVIDRAVKQGISRSRIIIDPGIGFGKNLEHNLTLINQLHEFESLDQPLLIGSSRKAFIRNILKPSGVKDLDPMLPEVETGTQASVAASIMRGAHIVRVHNVANTCATVKIIDAVLSK
ncbi:Dihydropteroate synthase [Desulfonema limicola]|uniref:Dihydropteroate synthase n=1 Tax=Desulfonema limicola TaxID=45656 RepID=A0A975GJR8_9BACT|nr:dihydropteroate synthase [Desulfonema limicola]QTA83772.1 Dihydropteroate synthase [Desulfonema limicola]